MAELANARIAPTALWIRRLAIVGVALCFVVVVLGAYVRLTAAGLGCPDWPGCYGHFSPIGAQESPASTAAFPGTPLDVGKAWREMIHRYAASTVGLIIVVITALAIAGRRDRVASIGFASALLATVVFQGVLGMLTVTWQLKPLIVTLHLLFGLTTLGMLWWLFLSSRRYNPARVQLAGETVQSSGTQGRSLQTARKLVVLALVLLAVQIALGGWTSSNYAAVACPDFPTCQNEWWPPMDYDNAFVLWHGLGINFEGGILEHPARVAIHFTHRLGALIATLALLAASLAVLLRQPAASARFAAGAVLAALLLQLVIGISMVESGFPLSLAAAHNAGAALLVLATLTLLRTLRPR